MLRGGSEMRPEVLMLVEDEGAVIHVRTYSKGGDRKERTEVIPAGGAEMVPVSTP